MVFPKVIETTGYVVQVEELEEEGRTTTYGLIVNDQEEYFQFVYGDKKDIFENDYVTCIGLPVSTNTFANTEGGATHSIIILAGDIQKIEQNN